MIYFLRKPDKKIKHAYNLFNNRFLRMNDELFEFLVISVSFNTLLIGD